MRRFAGSRSAPPSGLGRRASSAGARPVAGRGRRLEAPRAGKRAGRRLRPTSGSTIAPAAAVDRPRPRVTELDNRRRSARSRASGRTVADSATRWNSPASGTSRSTAVIRWVPRFDRRHRVDLVEDHASRGRSEASRRPRRGQQDVQALGRRDQDLRRPSQHLAGAPRPACRRCASAPGPARRSCPAAANARSSSASGRSRLRRMSLLSALSGDT